MRIRLTAQKRGGRHTKGATNRLLSILYGVISYVIFLASFLYAVGFVGNLVAPKSIDSGIATSFTQALFINLVLLSAFAIQHSVMARPGFKKWWTRFVPKTVERSTFVLLSSLLLFLLFWKWSPIPNIVWNLESSTGGTVLTVLFWVGWLIVLASTFMIDHFELFGLKQAASKGNPSPRFKTAGLYKWVRHPIMLGFVIAFWAAPVMSAGHLIFAAVTTAYIFVGILFEERDLVAAFGDTYRDYQKRVARVFPFFK